MIATPQDANLNTTADNAQELVDHSLDIDDTPNACGTGQQCHQQIGNILGSIENASGTGLLTTSTWRAYAEIFSQGSADFVHLYSSFSVSPVGYYTTYYDGTILHADGKNYYRYSALFGLYPSITVMNQSYFTATGSGVTDPIVTSASELSLFTGDGSSCPRIHNQEVGTHGYGTYNDDVSKLKVQTTPGSWANWETYANLVTTTGTDPQYYYLLVNQHGWFVNYSAWNTSAVP